MELQDVQINAKDLMDFMNSKINYEVMSKKEKAISFDITYKIKPIELFDFILAQELKTEDITINISGNDIVGVLNRAQDLEDKLKQSPPPKIPTTTPEQRAIHPSSL